VNEIAAPCMLLQTMCVCFLLLIMMNSCLFNQVKSGNEDELPEAYWNQEEYDHVMHDIHQERDLSLIISLRKGEEILSGRVIQVYTGWKKYGSEDKHTEIISDNNGMIIKNITYKHSFIGIRLASSFFTGENSMSSAFFSWYHPGAWVKELAFDIDLRHFISRVYPATEKGMVQCDLFYPPGWVEKKIWVSFQRLFALTSTPGEHPRGLSAPEAEIIRKGEGKITVILNMPGFFKKWNKNYSRPWQEGDLYPVSISLGLIPPGDFFRTTPSHKKDPVFIPKKYSKKVDVEDGDPYLSIPPAEHEEEVIVFVDINVPVTDNELLR
jgi:hypothetical protein